MVYSNYKKDLFCLQKASAKGRGSSLTKISCDVLDSNRVFVVESVILALGSDAINHDTGIGGQSSEGQRNVTVYQTNFSNCSFFL